MMAAIRERSCVPRHVLLLVYIMTTIFTYGITTAQNDSALLTTSSSGNSSDVVTTDTSYPAPPGPIPVLADLPEGWEQFCIRSENFVTWNITTLSTEQVRQMVKISCHLHHDQTLFFTDFRAWLNSHNTDVKHALKVECDVTSGGVFHVPWPMKVRNLVYLEVSGCKLPDYYSEYFDDAVTLIQDELRVLELRNCAIQVEILELYAMIENLQKTSIDVECGPLTLEKFTFSNITHDINVMDYLLDYGPSNMTLGAGDEYPDYAETNSDKLWDKFRNFNYQCDLKNLRHLDESFFEKMSGRHLDSLKRKSFYSELQVYNLSHIGFDGIPIQLREWRYRTEKMTYLDLSHNDIHEIEFYDSGLLENGIGTIDLQYNSIRQLRNSDLATFKRLRTATIDMRNNLINCSCGMLQDFREFLKTPDLGRYEYLRDLQCGWPESLRGQRVSDLSDVQVECTEGLYALTGILSSIVVLLIILVIILWRYRREVVILVFTRLHIVLPCQTVENFEDKDYDAFISYSSKDDDWVLKTLVQRLERQEDGESRFKLCVHHRDFEIGAAIADNVVRSVESSRHTIMVLSRNYVESEWCIYEFRTAMHQSLIERRKHLILIILEDVPRSELDSDLRKCLETFTYIQAGEMLFWDKLRYTLTVRSKGKSVRKPSSLPAGLSEKENLKSSSNNNIV